jgi:hypothetical protein
MTEQFAIIGQDSNQLIYGVIDAETVHDATLLLIEATAVPNPNVALANQIFFWRANWEGTRWGMQVVHKDQLADDRWRQQAPYSSLPAGDIGGDVQISEAWEMRYLRIRPDGDWAVYSPAYYAATTQNDEDSEPHIERRDEYVICTDPRDLGTTEWFSDYLFTGEPGPGTEERARRLADEHSVTSVTWTGEEFIGRQVPRQSRDGKHRWMAVL